MSFGFSAGDFIAVLKLLMDITDAVRATGQAQTQYHELLYQLEAYKEALEAVQRLYGDDEPSPTLVSISKQALGSMKLLSEQFQSLQRYSRFLSKAMKGKKDNNSFMKVQFMRFRWAFSEMEPVKSCQENIKTRVDDIHTLISIYQATRSAAESQRQIAHHQSVIGHIEQAHENQSSSLAVISSQGRSINDSVSEVHRLQLLLYQEMKQVMTRMPGQIQRQQPVYLHDALGRIWPISLELVQSAKEFITVLKMKFENIGNGNAVEKIEKGEFFLTCKGLIPDIELEVRPWEAIFQPGQTIYMAMITYKSRRPCLCPDCKMLCTTFSPNRAKRCINAGDLQCQICRLEFSVEDDPQILEEISSLCKTGVKALKPQVKSRLTLDEERKLYRSSRRSRPSPVLILPPHIDPMEIARVMPAVIGVSGFMMERRPHLESCMFDA